MGRGAAAFAAAGFLAQEAVDAESAQSFHIQPSEFNFSAQLVGYFANMAAAGAPNGGPRLRASPRY